nr:type IX secretion system sortase PorU [Saprospiraceae bacterium]
MKKGVYFKAVLRNLDRNTKIAIIGGILMWGSAALSSAQNAFSFDINIDWYEFPVPELQEGTESLSIPFFVDAGFTTDEIPLPVYGKRFEVPGPGELSLSTGGVQSVNPTFSISPELNAAVRESLQISYLIERERGQYYARLFFTPILKDGMGRIQLVERVSITAIFSPTQPGDGVSRDGFKEQSELADGDIYKIGVSRAGLYKIDRNFLSNELGINPAEVPVRKIRVLGNRGGMLPQLAGAERVDDVEEIPFAFYGSGEFMSQGEYLLFYAEGPQNWEYDQDRDRFNKPKNIYDDLNYYFIKIGNEDHLQLGELAPVSGAEQVFDQYEYLERYEVDRVNLMGAAVGFYGSGQRWFGDNLSNIRSRDYSSEFDLNGFIQGTNLRVITEFAIRSNASSTAQLTVGNETFTRTVSSVNVISLQNVYANIGLIDAQRVVGTDPLSVKYDLLNTGSISESWMDYIQLRGIKSLNYNGGAFSFRHSGTLNHQVSAFQVSNPTGEQLFVWDVTDPYLTGRVPYQTGPEGLTFSFRSDELRQFVVFSSNENFASPTFIEAIEKQNLHSIQSSELVIVYHPDFEQAALELAEHRRVFSGYQVVTASIDQVYNEFGGGSADPTAIRDFARMFYKRTSDFKYLLFVGDASYDYKGIMPDLPNQNFIPIYQTPNSLHAIFSFPSDDYFALLDDNEGSNLIGAIDIAIGRLPVRTTSEAQNVVRKIIHYDNNLESAGEWMSRLAFVADNGDNNLHLRQSRNLISDIRDSFPAYNFEKVFLDAFNRVSTPGGNRFPEANKSINELINRGVLVMNYFGHGGPSGWAQERVLQIPDITSWNNFDRLTLMVTATCSFANFDDPAVTSAGEHVVLNPNGGAFGLLTTTRLVFAFANERLTKAVFSRLFDTFEEDQYSIGEVMMLAKNASGTDTVNVNARKFALLGDPSQKLALATYDVETVSINEKLVSEGNLDTLGALDKVVVVGRINDSSGRLASGFNGVVDVTLFDKPVTFTTLGQGSGSNKQDFKIQKNILFKGSATVSQGRFSIEFIMPKDINYEIGHGKFSYFAYTGDSKRAIGSYNEVWIGGTSDAVIDDTEGPEIHLYMNDENFVFGGITDPNPTLLVLLEDESGINVAGNSIGRDLSAFLDGDINNKIVLNEFYQAEKDNFRKGTVNYPLSQLEDGPHEISVIAWDVLNNKSEARLEFIVMSDQKSVIKRMLNYPNPFMDHTDFQFEHNMPPGSLNVRVSIYSLSGRMVKDIHAHVISDGYRVTGIHWDGRDDYGDRLANGVYLYKVSVRSDHMELSNKTVESKFERLVILR